MDEKIVNRIFSQCGIENVQERGYWLVRTDGGIHYDDFVINSYIAIGWNYISVEAFNEKNESEIKSIITRQERIAPTHAEDDIQQDKGIAGYVTSIYNKLNRFIIEFSIGDIVIIPSRNTDRISIGVIIGDVQENPNHASDYLKANPETTIALCPYAKRRSVKWLKGINKEKIDVYLIKAFSSHHAISDVSDYADYINRELYPIYTRDHNIHSIIRTGHPDGLTFGELKSLIDLLSENMNEISSVTGFAYDANDVKVKLNINSPGIMEIIAGFSGAGICVAIIMLAWNHVQSGGKLKLNLKIKDHLEFSAETESLGIRGRENEAHQIRAEHDIKEITLANELKLRELNQRLDITIPDMSTTDDALDIEIEEPMDNS